VRRARMIVKAGLALGLLYGTAWADTVKFTVTFEPEKEGGSGKGSATLSLDAATKTLTGTIQYSGISAPPEMAAIEGPPPKPNDHPVTFIIPLPANKASPINFTMPWPDAAIAGIKSGEWVLLIGNKQGPEIGGDIKPAP
jgi:hypothetical protein